MRVALVTITVMGAILLSARLADARDGQPCIAKAAEALPHIAGLVIKHTRTHPASPEVLLTWKGQSRPIMVDIDFVATGAQETYSFMCVITRSGAFVQRTMN